MADYLLDWANLLVRWLHLISGIAWIGASFYFVMLDLSLRKPQKKEDESRGVNGELWAVHGGGVYQSQKFLAGPIGEPLSEHLHWSKWEAYTTWLSGMGMLAIIYWFGASTYLIDASVMELSEPVAISISVLLIVSGWLVYDGLCRVLGSNETLLIVLVLIYMLVIDWLLFQLFSARAATLHVGAIMGTAMAANVFFHIIPGQKKMVAEIRQRMTPNPSYQRNGKQRSVHNTYFTLPVLFTMISNHYPMIYSHQYAWISLGLVLFAGVLIRQFFVLRHTGRQAYWLVAVALLMLFSVLVWLMPKPLETDQHVSFSQVEPVIQQRCVSCHATTPTQPGFLQPPKGIVLETRQQAEQWVSTVVQTVENRYMPIGNLTDMTDEERLMVAAWGRGHLSGDGQ